MLVNGVVFKESSVHNEEKRLHLRCVKYRNFLFGPCDMAEDKYSKPRACCKCQSCRPWKVDRQLNLHCNHEIILIVYAQQYWSWKLGIATSQQRKVKTSSPGLNRASERMPPSRKSDEDHLGCFYNVYVQLDRFNFFTKYQIFNNWQTWDERGEWKSLRTHWWNQAGWGSCWWGDRLLDFHFNFRVINFKGSIKNLRFGESCLPCGIAIASGYNNLKVSNGRFC